MKRKILILLCAVCLVLSFSVTAFASTEVLPNITLEEEFIVVRSAWYGNPLAGDPLAYVVLPFSSLSFSDGRYSYNSGAPCYYLENNAWKSGTMKTNWDDSNDNILFDSSFTLGIQNTIQFETPISFNDIIPFYDGLKGQITVQNAVGVLLVGVGAVVGIVFMWWGARKGVKALMSAFRKGKISL